MTHTIGFDADEYNVEYAVLNHKLCKETSLQPVSSTTEAIGMLRNLLSSNNNCAACAHVYIVLFKMNSN